MGVSQTRIAPIMGQGTLTMKPTIRSANIVHEDDADQYPDTLEECRSNYRGCSEGEITEYLRQDAERIDAFNRAGWYYIGVYVECETLAAGIIQRFRTPGLWGIESDSDAPYLNGVAQDEFAILRDQLELYGVDTSNIDALIASAEIVTR